MTSVAIEELLQNTPHRFELFQITRMLEILAVLASGKNTNFDARAGGPGPPEDEPIRFASALSFDFLHPAAEVARPLQRPAQATVGGRSRADTINITSTTMGVATPYEKGTLPHYYAELALERERYGDYRMRDFFDLFNHRILSFYYKAQRLGAPYASVEYALARDIVATTAEQKKKAARTDWYSEILRDLSGRAADDDANSVLPQDYLISWTGYFCLGSRPLSALKTMLSNTLQVHVEFVENTGKWISVPTLEQSKVGDPGTCRLGETTIAGSSVWDPMAAVQMRIGPMTRDRYYEFLPGNVAFQRLQQMCRMYLGSEVGVDLCLLLKASDAPPMQLSSKSDGAAPRLGWTSWMPQPQTEVESDHILDNVCVVLI